jgi:glycerol-3-phosphate acyltransferase PlsY
MYWIFLISGMAIGYLSGSLSFAIIVSTLVGSGDIREVGTKNAGTANVGRTIGKGWGAVVFLGDIGKAIVPLVIAENTYFSMDEFSGVAGLVLMGMAVILGHRKPVYFGFRGGGGLATTLGVMGFFAPFELMVSMAVGFGLGMVLFRNKELKIGRWIPMLIILINPVVCLLLSPANRISISGRIGFGGMEMRVVVGVAALAAYIVVSNAGKIIETIRGAEGGVDHSGDS